jgi:hypothetical protein
MANVQWTDAQTPEQQFLFSMLENGAPANDCALGQAAIGQAAIRGSAFSAVVLKRLEDGSFAIGLMELHSASVYAVLRSASDETIIAEWRQFGRRYSLPLAIEQGDGTIEMIATPMPPAPRRRGSSVAQRRSRFSARRFCYASYGQERRSA